MSTLVIGYARTSLFGDDAQRQRAALLALGAPPDRVYLDAGLVGMTRPRPALREAIAALRAGDTLAVTALVRLARSLPDAVDLLGRLSDLQVTLAVDDIRFAPGEDGLGLLSGGMQVAWQRGAVAHSDRTREGLRAARTRGQLRGAGPEADAAAGGRRRRAVLGRPLRRRQPGRDVRGLSLDGLPRYAEPSTRQPKGPTSRP